MLHVCWRGQQQLGWRAMRSLWVKQKACSLATMGIPSEYLAGLTGGTVAIVKLDVYNLHRFYAPVGEQNRLGSAHARIQRLYGFWWE